MANKENPYQQKPHKKTGPHYRMRFSDKLFLCGQSAKKRSLYKELAIDAHLSDMKAIREGTKDPLKKLKETEKNEE